MSRPLQLRSTGDRRRDPEQIGLRFASPRVQALNNPKRLALLDKLCDRSRLDSVNTWQRLFGTLVPGHLLLPAPGDVSGPRDVIQPASAHSLQRLARRS